MLGKVNDQERSWKGGRNFPKSSDSGGDGKSSYGYEGRNLGQEEEETFAEYASLFTFGKLLRKTLNLLLVTDIMRLATRTDRVDSLGRSFQSL